MLAPYPWFGPKVSTLPMVMSKVSTLTMVGVPKLAPYPWLGSKVSALTMVGFHVKYPRVSLKDELGVWVLGLKFV